MDVSIATVATIAAVVFAAGAFVLLARELHVASGTLFMLTAISIYIRETRK